MKKLFIISATILGFFLMSCVALQPKVLPPEKKVISQALTLGDLFGFVDPKADSGIDPSEFMSWEIPDRHVIIIEGPWIYVCHHLVSPHENAFIKEVHAVVAISPILREAYFTSYVYRINGKILSFSWDADREIFTRDLNKSDGYGETI